ncbi:hypothetical protein [Kitasatospora sp. KL5]|uniref:hypothetical protein n=1 Tax=Kitasatospora sp. KL5 TaxID=3425125 RepID=UPI003D6FB971
MRIRPAAIAALLIATSFGAAACGPEDSGSDTALQAPSTAAAAPSAPAGEPSADKAAPAASASAGKATGAAEDDNGGRGPNCKEYFKTHKVIHVRSVDKGFGKLVAQKVTANCTDNGLFFNWEEKDTSFTVSPEAKITVYTAEYYAKAKTVTVKNGTAADGMAHVKTCAETPHATEPEKLPAGYVCTQDTYEYTVDSKGAITSMRETWSS